MQSREELLDSEQLKRLSTPELIRRAIDEGRLLVKAEVLHARRELEADLRAGRRSAMFLGGGSALLVSGVTLLLVALAWSLPLAAPLGAMLVGVPVIGGAVALGLLGRKSLPTHPLDETRRRLEQDVARVREGLQ